MKRNILYVARYSLVRLIFIFLITYPLPMYLLVGASIDLFRESKYLNSISLLFLTAPLVFIFFETVLTREIIFYDYNVSKKFYFIGEVSINYGDGYIICPTGFSKLLSSAHHIRSYSYSFFYRILFVSFFFSKETRNNVKNIINFLTDYSHVSVRKFTKNKLLIG